MSSESLSQIKTLLYCFDRPSLHTLSTLVTACYHPYPLRSLRCIRVLLTVPEYPPIQPVIDSGVIPWILRLLQQNSYNFAMMFSGYIRELDFDYEIPSTIVECIAHACKLNSVDESIQVECRWILSNITSGNIFVLPPRFQITMFWYIQVQQNKRNM